jgi:hypothetical protein
MRRRTATVLAGAAALAAGVATVAASPGDVTVVSLSAAGTLGNQPAEASSVSADGRFVAVSSAAALAGVPTGGIAQLYVRDRVAGTTVLASGAGNAAANSAVDVQDVDNVLFAISGNGRYAVFASTATNLTPADADANKDVFRKDLITGAVTLVSVNSAGQKANGAGVFGDPDVSYDGRVVSFGSGTSTNLFPNDGNNASDIVVRDIGAGTTALAAVNAAGVQANGTTERSAMSADGHVVAFEAPTGTNNLLPGDASPGDVNDVVVRNLAAGTTGGASNPAAAAGSGFPDVSGNGRYVAFESGEKYDAVNDVSAGNDAYRRDMTSGAITLVSALNNGAIGSTSGGARPATSADGARVSFRTLGNDLVGTDANAVNDVYVRDPATQVTRRASVAANGTTESSTASERTAIAGNGGLVSFVHDDAGETGKLVATDTNAQPDALAKELAPGDTTPPALTVGASAGRATDPSGIGEVTVNGAPVAVAADGSFAVPPVPVADVRAADGAGNVATGARVIPPGGAGTPVTPRVQRLKARLKGRKITIRFRLTADARVTVTLLRRTVREKPARRVVLTRVRRPLTKALKAGQRSVVLTLARRPRAGRYVVRVRANAGGLTSTATTTLVVKPLRSKRR